MSTAEAAIPRHEHAIRHELTLAKAVITGEHFVYKSGRHGDTYVDCDRLFVRPASLKPVLGHWCMRWFEGCSTEEKPEVVIAPAVGGVYLVSAFAFHSQYWTLKTVWADKDRDDFVLDRAGFAEAVDGHRVLVLEDVITTGGSAVKTANVVGAAGGDVVGIACIVNRSRATTAETLGVPRFTAGVQLDIPSFAVGELPDELASRPIVTNLAHGAAFQERNPDYEGGFTTLDLDPRIPFGEVRTVRYQDGARNLKEVRGKIINPDRRAHPEAEILLEITAPDGDHRGGYLPLSRWQISKISPE